MKKSATPDDVLPGKTTAPVPRRQRRTQLPTGPLWKKVVDTSAPAFTPPATPPKPADLPPEDPQPMNMPLPPPTPPLVLDLPTDSAALPPDEVPQALLGRYGGPRGPEFRVFPVTKEGRGQKLFSFPPDAYPDADSLRAKIGRDYGPGEFDVILHNQKGQPVAGGTTRLFVDETPRAAAALAGAAPPSAPVVLQAPAPDSYKAEFFELVKVIAGRPPQAAKSVDWAAVIAAGSGVIGAVGAIAVPLISKTLDIKSGPKETADPMETLTKALGVAETLRQKLGGSGGGGDRKPTAYDVAIEGFNAAKAVLADFKTMMAMEAAKTPATSAPKLGALPAPAQPPPPSTPPPVAAAEPPEPAYPATPAGLLDFVRTHLEDVLALCDAGKPAKIGASYLAVLIQDHAQLLPVARQLIALPQLMEMLSRDEPRIAERSAWFERLRVALVQNLAEDSDNAPADGS